jgi:hypothetical protein
MRFAIKIAAQFVALVIVYIVVSLLPISSRAEGWVHLALIAWGLWLAVQAAAR